MTRMGAEDSLEPLLLHYGHRITRQERRLQDSLTQGAAVNVTVDRVRNIPWNKVPDVRYRVRETGTVWMVGEDGVLSDVDPVTGEKRWL